MIEFPCCGEVEVEDYFLCCIGLECNVLALHILSQAKRHRTFRYLVKKTKLFCLGCDICYHDLACVGCARQELVGLAALFFLRVLATHRFLFVAMNDHDVVA